MEGIADADGEPYCGYGFASNMNFGFHSHLINFKLGFALGLQIFI